MNTPDLQAGDQKAHISSPGLKAGAIHEFNIIELNVLVTPDLPTTDQAASYLPCTLDNLRILLWNDHVR
jgi:hypothetical protein